MGKTKDTPDDGYGGKLVFQKRSVMMRERWKQICERKGAGVLDGKKSTMYY